MVYARGRYWFQSCLIALLMISMIEQSASSASLQVNWEDRPEGGAAT